MDYYLNEDIKKKRGRIAVVEACKGRVTNPWDLDGPV